MRGRPVWTRRGAALRSTLGEAACPVHRSTPLSPQGDLPLGASQWVPMAKGYLTRGPPNTKNLSIQGERSAGCHASA